MKTHPKLFSLAAVLWLSIAGAAVLEAQTWETVDDFQLASNYYTSGNAITVDGSGTVFAAGMSSGNTNYAVVRRSRDKGVIWETVDTSSGWYEVKGITASRSGVVALVGSARGTNSSVYAYWRVRLSRDGGTTWSTVDGVVQSYESRAVAASFLTDGSLYVSGNDFDSSNWIVHRTTDLGVTWSEVAKVPQLENLGAMRMLEDGMVLGSGENWQVFESTNLLASWRLVDDWYPVGSVGNYRIRGITQDRFGNYVIVGGNFSHYPNAFNWVARRSLDGGTTWEVTDQLQFQSLGYGATGVVTDAAGRIWATGSDDVGMLTRMSSDGGATWSESDSFTYDIATIGNGITADSAGNIYAIGMGEMQLPGKPHWIVRKLAAGLPPSPPSLSTSFNTITLSLTWPATAIGFVLQSATTLTNGGDWLDSNLTPIIVGDQNVVTVDPTGSAGFFRLRGQ